MQTLSKLGESLAYFYNSKDLYQFKGCFQNGYGMKTACMFKTAKKSNIFVSIFIVGCLTDTIFNTPHECWHSSLLFFKCSLSSAHNSSYWYAVDTLNWHLTDENILLSVSTACSSSFNTQNEACYIWCFFFRHGYFSFSIYDLGVGSSLRIVWDHCNWSSEPSQCCTHHGQKVQMH